MAASELLRAMLDGLHVNPFNPREKVLVDKKGNPVAGVIIREPEPGVLYLETIRALKKGGGRKLMEILVERADELGAVITGDVKPLPSHVYRLKRLSMRELLSWYRQFGFEAAGDEIVRVPNKGAKGSARR